MTGEELHIWRRYHKLSQGALAKLLGTSRLTISNWELGKHRLPLDLPARLEQIAYTTAPKPVAEPPQWLSRETAFLHPDLQLYKSGSPRSGPVWDDEHPRILLHWLHGDLPQLNERIPLSMLDSPFYREALAIWRDPVQRAAVDRDRAEYNEKVYAAISAEIAKNGRK